MGRASSSPDDGDDAVQFAVDAIAALHGSGAETERTEERARQVGAAIGQPVTVTLGWSSSEVEFESPDGNHIVRRFTKTPDGLALNRVIAVDGILNGLSAGSLTVPAARRELRAATGLPVVNVFLFALACALGGCSLAIIFGVRHAGTLGLIAAGSVLGAFVRRALAKLGANNYWQVAAAGLLAGLTGALSSGLGISSSLGLAAVCPCMILVPGPHLLKGALDLGRLRIPLGLARLTFATITLMAITAGLLIGLWIGGADLAPDPPGRSVPIWVDGSAAGVVAVCYGVFYSAPLRILYWPFIVGMLAHALRWVALNEWDAPSWLGAGLACLLVGSVLVPVSRRFQIPFSAIGFASVVSLMPGLLVFRALGSLVHLQKATGPAAEQLLVDAVNNANTALLTIVAMGVGFLLPAAAWSRFDASQWRRGQ